MGNKGGIVNRSFPNMMMGLSTALLLAAPFKSRAFSLLGPYESWMEATNGLRQIGDIGGPMDITNGYRWNVPVLTYGFDQSFLDFFGTNGEAAVTGAIQILNDLPPASQMVLTNFPSNSSFINYTAQAESLEDLKSKTLAMLLEQMGLAQPTRYIFVLKQWNPVFIDSGSEYLWPAGTIPNYIVQRNFDPQTLLPTNAVNQSMYSGIVFSGSPTSMQAEFSAPVGYGNVVLPISIDPLSVNFSVADSELNPGTFYSGLTYDDVGGLTYLLSTNDIRYETLLPGIVGAGTNADSYVNGAWRPGVDKITFMPQPVDSQSGAFLPTTNYFTDTYITNGILHQQQLARVIAQPDFLFCAGDLTSGTPWTSPWVTRSGTSNWVNNAAANGNPGGAGPGVIQPPVRIMFEKLGPFIESVDGNVSAQSTFWSSFDGTTNPPVVYPVAQSGTNELSVRMWLEFSGNVDGSFEWNPVSASGAVFAMETSSNLVDWTTLFTMTNNGSVCTYLSQNPVGAAAFYRVVPQ